MSTSSGGKLKLVLIGSYQQGGNFTIDFNDGTTGQGHVENAGGVGGGFVQQWDLPPSWGKLSFVQLAALYGWGLVDFDPTDVNRKFNQRLYFCARCGWYHAPPSGTKMVPSGASILLTISSRHGRTSTGYGIRQITSPWALGQRYQFHDQGFTASRSTSTARFPAHRLIHICLLPA